MSFFWPDDAGLPRPGQFLTIRIADTTVPLLRRPFAFSYYDGVKKRASIIYQKRGRGTEMMCGMARGDAADVIGPLGNFIADPPVGKTPLLIAGGIGFGPVYYYSSVLKDLGISHRFVLGVRSKSAVPGIPRFLDQDPVLCTDDGSRGFHGTALDYCATLGADIIKKSFLVCCGPRPMLAGCHALASAHSADCFVVMEQTMACGVGACMGCVVRTEKAPGFARVCCEGPVFSSREIVWT
ncbi:MAG: dihydroorotate dehydrogenase electron transfer subunit [Spirochaetales bacterium]|nr:dihydroorotate dehydrogenase electron transfer subunit [Spirochaetales bacterium]